MFNMENIFLVLLIIVFAIAVNFSYLAWKSVIWFPTRRNDAKRVFELANLKPGQKFCDLGCGDGRLVAAAAKHGAQAVGYEHSLIPFIIALIYKRINKLDYKIYYKNFWKVDLSEFDLIYMFLYPRINKKIKAKFDKELKSGAQVVSYVWPIPEWQEAKLSFPKKDLPLYLYVKK